MVEAYLKAAIEADRREAEARRRGLQEAVRGRLDDVRRAREAVAVLVARAGSVDLARARERDSAAIEAYKVLTQQVLKADLELVEERARLDRLRAASKGGPSAGPVDAVAAFYAVPEVAEVQSKLVKARESAARAGRIARDTADVSRVAAQKEADGLQARLDALWARLGPSLGRAGREAAGRGAEVEAASARVEALEARLSQLGGRLEALNARTRAAGADELALEFGRQDLARAESVLEAMARGRDRVEVEAGAPPPRFRREYEARASSLPRADLRAGAMAAAPIGMFLAVLGLTTMVEARSGRVVDPEEVPGRLRLPVLGVVPPLPGPRPLEGPGSGRARARSRRELDRFIQGLDHLRVAICSGVDPRGRPRRCLLITSASAGEGKTTLAAQLAERCVNAGLPTLLIDADLRDPGLSRMLDLPTAPGLVEVLAGEAMAEEVISVVGGAGGLHFLPAGSRRVDPGRLLEGDRLARLLARARESFELVIVDAPPVLPVPDALTIGRWVDGVILAVRSDTSRYPHVEQAHRRLVAVGLPVLGVVVGGVRGAGSAYHGPYDPSYGTPPEDEGRPPAGA